MSGLALLVRQAGWDAVLADCDAADRDRMAESVATVDKALAAGQQIYGLTQGFGPLVRFAAESEAEQGASLIAHLGTGQGRPLDPDACRLIVRLRLDSMRKGISAVSPGFWHVLAGLWNRSFTPAIPRDGTVSASGDLQPLAHAALAALSADRVDWPVREALAFVNGTGASLAVPMLNQQSAMRLVRAVALLTARVVHLLKANPEHYRPGVDVARGQPGQSTVAAWLRDVPMALNGANSVSEALDFSWLVVGSLGVGVAQLAAMAGQRPPEGSLWAALAGISPPLAADRPLADEVRAGRDLISTAAGNLLLAGP